jgi:serine protease
MNAIGRPGGAGVKVAVLETGAAYSSRRGFRRSPDLLNRFLKGYDFVDDDPYPDDLNGHGTHVASTIAETTGNSFGVTGLAYGVRLMPVRVLDRAGTGDSVAISAGLRYAARKGAKVINLSFEFDSSVTRGQIPDILDALRYARRKGALVIGASGNFSAHAVAYPARATHVMSVGATTEHLCQADYSNAGNSLDISAPGGGLDADIPGDPNCRPGAEPAGRDIYQMTFTTRSVRRFGLPSGYVGTSMAAPHVSATAALVIASGLIGRNPTPDQVEARLKATARDLGTPGPDSRYGAGMVDAARAVTP